MFNIFIMMNPNVVDMTRTSPVLAPRCAAADVVERIRDLHPVISGDSADGERNRRLSQTTVDALQEAGAFKIAVPARLGGLELSVRDQLDVIAAIAEADGSAAWVTVLYAQSAWTMGTESEEDQHEVFAADSDARMSGILSPSARATPVDGGWRLTGRGYSATGCSHATWIAVNSYLLDDAGEVVGLGTLRTPIQDVTIEDTWFVSGMRGTGSNCAVWDDVFVPANRMSPMARFIEGDYPTPFKDEVLYRAPLSSVLLTLMLGPQLGLGKAALEFVVSKVGKGIAYTHFEAQSESTGFQIQIARAATLLETARLHAYRAAERLGEWSEQDHYPNLLERASIRTHVSATLESTNEAINMLLFAHGAGSFAESNPLQRIWRDSNAVARHAFSLPEVNYETYGKALLGIEEQISPLV
jgi:alkylation response protein AidB-like acyl-CoA dehydrogenase